LIAEIVIVGEVPDSYMKYPLNEKLWLDEWNKIIEATKKYKNIYK
jgi:hypothetical protein